MPDHDQGPLGVTLRRAQPADADAVTSLVHAAYVGWVPRLGGPPGPMQLDYRQVIRDRTVTLAEAGGRLVGLVVTSDGPDGVCVENVAVHPRGQGRGIGGLLLAHAESGALHRGRSVVLYTHELMTTNRDWYVRRGYTDEGRRVVDGAPLVFMRKHPPASTAVG